MNIEVMLALIIGLIIVLIILVAISIVSSANNSKKVLQKTQDSFLVIQANLNGYVSSLLSAAERIASGSNSILERVDLFLNNAREIKSVIKNHEEELEKQRQFLTSFAKQLLKDMDFKLGNLLDKRFSEQNSEVLLKFHEIVDEVISVVDDIFNKRIEITEKTINKLKGEVIQFSMLNPVKDLEFRSLVEEIGLNQAIIKLRADADNVKLAFSSTQNEESANVKIVQFNEFSRKFKIEDGFKKVMNQGGKS